MKRIFSRVGLGITLFLAVQQVLVIIISALLRAFAPEILETSWIMWVVLYVPLYFAGFPVLLLVFRGIPDSTGGYTEKKTYSALNIIAMFCACLTITYLLNTFSTILSSMIAQLKGAEVTNSLAQVSTNSNPWLNLFMVALVAPVMEEIVFRRLLYNKLIVFGGPVYILVSGLIFGLFHVNFYQLLYAFVLGVIFAAVTYYSGTIKYSVILHVLLNFSANGIGVLIMSYGNLEVQTIYGYFIIISIAIGIGALIWWGVKGRRTIEFAPAEVALPSKGIIFANPGMILFLVAMGTLIIVSVLA